MCPTYEEPDEEPDEAQHLAALLAHCRGFFQGHELRVLEWRPGPLYEIAPWFRVLRIAPGPRLGLWSYASIGASLLRNDPGGGLEFIIVAESESPRLVELVAMSAYYHGNRGLGLGHTVPIGDPWIDASSCDHLLMSRPYPFTPALELCQVPGRHVHFLWLVPITEAERDFKSAHGLDALEQRFEARAVQYWRPNRASVV